MWEGIQENSRIYKITFPTLVLSSFFFSAAAAASTTTVCANAVEVTTKDAVLMLFCAF